MGKTKVKCPFFKRKVSSYRFSGLICTANFEQGQTIGDIRQWTPEQREKFMADRCNGCYTECGNYKSNEARGGRM